MVFFFRLEESLIQSSKIEKYGDPDSLCEYLVYHTAKGQLHHLKSSFASIYVPSFTSYPFKVLECLFVVVVFVG